jgi:CMP-N-acetylneuraminic acid synthetase
MINNKKILGIVTARAGSKGIKNKNLIKVNNRPLIYWPIKALKKSKYVDQFILSSDSKKIMKLANDYGCETPFLRPKSLARDSSLSIDVVLHSLNFFKKRNFFFDYVVLLEPTSPLTTYRDVDNALKYLHNNKDVGDSIVGASENIKFHPDFNFKIKKNKLINFKKNIYSKRRQELSKVYFFDGSLYISKVSSIYKKKTFYHKKTLTYETPKWKSFEIDDQIDLIILNSIMKYKNTK